MLFSYVVNINNTTIVTIERIEEDMYRFMRPLWEVWLALDILKESLPIPCGPIFSCHPRSIVRDERRREELKESAAVILCDRSTKNHCSVRVL